MDLVLLVMPRLISTKTNIVEYEITPKIKRLMSGKSVYIVETKYVLKISSFFPKKNVPFDKLSTLERRRIMSH